MQAAEAKCFYGFQIMMYVSSLNNGGTVHNMLPVHRPLGYQLTVQGKYPL